MSRLNDGYGDNATLDRSLGFVNSCDPLRRRANGCETWIFFYSTSCTNVHNV